MIYLIALEILILIIFLVLIWKLIIDYQFNEAMDTIPELSICKFCGFESVEVSDFCLVCAKDKNGNTKENLAQTFRQKSS